MSSHFEDHFCDRVIIATKAGWLRHKTPLPKYATTYLKGEKREEFRKRFRDYVRQTMMWVFLVAGIGCSLNDEGRVNDLLLSQRAAGTNEFHAGWNASLDNIRHHLNDGGAR